MKIVTECNQNYDQYRAPTKELSGFERMQSMLYESEVHENSTNRTSNSKSLVVAILFA